LIARPFDATMRLGKVACGYPSLDARGVARGSANPQVISVTPRTRPTAAEVGLATATRSTCDTRGDRFGSKGAWSLRAAATPV
jgi:hypothetical protein